MASKSLGRIYAKPTQPHPIAEHAAGVCLPGHFPGPGLLLHQRARSADPAGPVHRLVRHHGARHQAGSRLQIPGAGRRRWRLQGNGCHSDTGVRRRPGRHLDCRWHSPQHHLLRPQGDTPLHLPAGDPDHLLPHLAGHRHLLGLGRHRRHRHDGHRPQPGGTRAAGSRCRALRRLLR